MQKQWEERRLAAQDRSFREKRLTRPQKHILALLRSGCYISQDMFVMDQARRVCKVQNKRTIYRLLDDKFIRWDTARRCWVLIP